MVASETILQAWAVPAWFSESPFDHTWVTDFDNRTAPYQRLPTSSPQEKITGFVGEIFIRTVEHRISRTDHSALSRPT